MAALALEDPRLIERVHRTTAVYFAEDSSPGAAVEYAYHRLALGEPVLGLDQSTLRQLEASVADLPSVSADFVLDAVDTPLTHSFYEGLLVWERKTLTEADAALRDGQHDRCVRC